MFRVRDFMTADPICIDPSEKITAAIDLMRFNHIHRIPVINQEGKLVGLITEGMISANQSATSLSIYELNYLLAKTNVKTVMKKRPVFIEEDALLEEATEKLLKHDIGCLPVVNLEGKVTGILTQNDVFKAFLNMLGWNEAGTRLTLKVKDETGALGKLGDIFAGQDTSISTLGVYDNKDGVAKLLVKTRGAAPDTLTEALELNGFEVTESQSFAPENNE